jgi:hypothetical protein
VKRKILFFSGIGVAMILIGLIVFIVTGGLDRSTTARARGDGPQVLVVELVAAFAWYDITPDVIEVEPGTELILEVVNHDDEVHDLEVGEHRTRMLDPGEFELLELGVVTKSIGGRCTVGDHDSAGMTMDVRVV